MAMAERASRVSSLVAVLAFASLLSSCVDEQIVFRDRELFETPPTEAMGFLGYTNHETKLTVCGNCHVGEQSRWEEHAHASAWADLQASGQSQSSCAQCHTVNQLGNPTTAQGGYLAVPAERYQDVQCESCHGPGLLHVQNPDVDANHPVASIKVGADLSAGCGQCHQGQHHPFVEEWAVSGHGILNTVAAPRPTCNGCHEAKGILRRFGVTNTYLEEFSEEPLPITCAVCHDPHGNDNSKNLRFAIDVPSAEENLCAQCHNRRSVPESSSHGLEPHAPEGALLFGEAGWFPPGSSIEPGKIIASHGSEGNPRLCATCHVNSFTLTDPQGNTIGTTGHTFQAIPCKGPDGLPRPGDCALSTEARDFSGCTGGGCHLNEQAAFSALFSAATDLQASAEDLLALLRQVDENLDAPGGVIDPTNPEFNAAEGATYNYYLATFGGTDRASPLLTYAAAAVHNPFLMRSLLAASRQVVRSTYGVAPPAGAPGGR
jgi:predicted CXXCH cytochrome family protein